ncbi:MAG: glutamate 5-kinase [Candidatus Sericytochromatia bacterium]|nr:glutamate 5-kinase [Candidatus Sericytochromatia bacterium]
MGTPWPSATSSSISSTDGARLLVIKVGTTTLMGADGPDLTVLGRLADVLAGLHQRGHRVVLVTSGAVGTGRWRLQLAQRPRSIPEKQAAAAVGQGILMHLYEQVLAARGLTSAQLLLTRADLGDRARYVNASNTLQVLLHAPGVVPIVNENDSVAVEELKFGDNDSLSALVASVIDAQLLFVLSDVDGLYDADPRQNPQARRLTEVPAITPEIEALAGGSGSGWGTGGMATKVAAARIATSCGIPMVLLHGRAPEAVLAYLDGESLGTTFAAQATRMEGRKRWLAWGGLTHGRLRLDAGAVEAIRAGGRSLLPAGVKAVEGGFEPGDLVALLDPDGREFARGMVNYSSAQLERIAGRHSSEIESILGDKPYDEAIHRNNMVTL